MKFWKYLVDSLVAMKLGNVFWKFITTAWIYYHGRGAIYRVLIECHAKWKIIQEPLSPKGRTLNHRGCNPRSRYSINISPEKGWICSGISGAFLYLISSPGKHKKKYSALRPTYAFTLLKNSNEWGAQSRRITTARWFKMMLFQSIWR